MARRKRRFDRRLLYAGLAILFVVIMIIGWDEVKKVIGILLHSAPELLTLAVLAEAGYYLAQTGVYTALCQAGGLPYHFLDMLPLTVAWPFISVTVPTVGLAGIALLADDARQRDHEPGRAIVAGFLYLTFLYASYGAAIWVALLYLHQQGLLYPYQFWPGVVHALGLAGLLLALGLAGWAPEALTRILDFLAAAGRRLVRLVRRSAKSPVRTIAPTVAQCHQAVRRAVQSPGQLGRAVLCAAVAQGANLLALWLIVRSLGQEVSLIHLLTVYGISYLITLVSPTPQGIGFTEGATVAIFSSLGASFAGATAITLAFRGVTFWLPFVVGFVVVRRLRTFQKGSLSALREGEAASQSASFPEPPAK